MENTAKEHLYYFKVENFKRFDSLEINNIGQFNVILGDNNVGKTSLLEALLFNKDGQQFINHLYTVLFEFRRIDEKVDDILKLFFKKSDNIFLETTFNINSDKYLIEVKNGELDIHYDFDDFSLYNRPSNGNRTHYLESPAKLNIPYIPFHLGYDSDLITYYSRSIQSKRSVKKDLIKALEIMIPIIEGIEIEIPENKIPSLAIAQTTMEETLPLSIFGEGSIKLFRILAQIIVHKGRRLMIDEIDAGVHFRRFKDFWRIILKTAQLHEVQLFVTTHSMECLQSFKEVLEEVEMVSCQSAARCIELLEMPDASIKSYTYGFEEFKTMLDTGTNIRGGKF
jgi:AAA15 family ATPase/GTPase